MPVQAILMPATLMFTEKQYHVRLEDEKRKMMAADSSLFFEIRAMKIDSRAKYMNKFADKYL